MNFFAVIPRAFFRNKLVVVMKRFVMVEAERIIDFVKMWLFSISLFSFRNVHTMLIGFYQLY